MPKFLEFSNIGNFVVAFSFAIRFGSAHGATAVDFVFGVLMEVFVVACFGVFLSITIVVTAMNIVINSPFPQSLENGSSSVFATSHKHSPFRI